MLPSFEGSWCYRFCCRNRSNLCPTSLVSGNLNYLISYSSLITGIIIFTLYLPCINSIISVVNLCSMDGFRVVRMEEVIKQVDILVTCTGRLLLSFFFIYLTVIGVIFFTI